jgi:hypothetical protein
MPQQAAATIMSSGKCTPRKRSPAIHVAEPKLTPEEQHQADAAEYDHVVARKR